MVPGQKRNWWSIGAWSGFAFATVFGIAALVNYEGCDTRCSDWDFVTDLTTEGTKEGIVVRWNRPPSITVKNANDAERNMVSGAVYEYNEVLAGVGFNLQFVPNGPAEIEVTFVPRDEFNEMSDGTLFDVGVQGYCQTYFTKNGRVERAEIFVSQGLAEGDKWGAVLHEIGHALGLMGHTDRHLSSLFYKDFKGGAFSDGLSVDDRKILQFLYGRLHSGDGEVELREKFEKHWVAQLP